MMFKLLAFFLTVAIAGTTTAGEYNAVMNIGDPMPAFKDLPGVSGKTYSSENLTSEIVVLVSLANHCPWVQGMDAGLVALAKEFDGQSVEIVAFSVNHREDDRLPAMREHAKANGYTFPYVFDESQQIGRDLGATRTPEYFVFDSERKLVYMGLLTDSPAKKGRSGEVRHINGEPSEFYVRDAVAATLAGGEVVTAETRAHGCSVKYQ